MKRDNSWNGKRNALQGGEYHEEQYRRDVGFDWFDEGDLGPEEEKRRRDLCDRMPMIQGAAIFEDLPPVDWLIEELDFCPGAPAMIAGYGFVGKTWLAQAMCTAIAAGLPVWNTLRARRGRVLHIDFEQGARETRRRYQQLCNGMSIQRESIVGNLALASPPGIFLDSDLAERVFLASIEGFDFVLIDSFKAATPEANENESEVRRYLDRLSRCSEKTGATICVIHHAKKPDQTRRTTKFSLRGSSAIYDACSSVITLVGGHGQPILLRHEKARTRGTLHSGLRLRIENVASDFDPQWGIRVIVEPDLYEQENAADRAGEDLVLQLVAANPGMNASEIAKKAERRKENVGRWIESLSSSSRLVNVGTLFRPKFRVSAVPDRSA